MKVLWQYYFIRNEVDRFREVAAECPEARVKSFYGAKHIRRYAYEEKDVDLLDRLLNLLRKAGVSREDVATLYSEQIDILSDQQEFENAALVIAQAIKEVDLKMLTRHSLLRVKQGVESAGKVFPYNISNE